MLCVKQSGMILLLLCSLLGTTVKAQTADSINDNIISASRSLKASTLSRDEKTAISEQLDHARSSLKESTDFDSQLKQYERDVLQANEKLAKLRQQKKKLADEVFVPPKQQSSEQLANQLVVLDAQQNNLQSQIEELQSQAIVLSKRPAAIAEELQNAKNALDNTLSTLEKNQQTSEHLPNVSNKLALQAKVLSLRSQITLLEREVNTIPARQSLIDAQIELLKTQIETGKRQIQAIQKPLEKNRVGNASQLLEKSQQELAEAADSVALTSLAKENMALAKSLQNMVLEAPKVDDNIARLRQHRQNLQQSAQTVDRVLITGQITDELGILLHRLRAGLPQEGPLKNRLEQINEQSVHHQLNLILWQDKQRVLNDETGQQTPYDESVPLKNQSEDQLSSAQLAFAKTLNESQQVLVKQLIDTSTNLIDKLTDEKALLTEVTAKTLDLKTLLDRSLVWLPSYTKLSDNIVHNLMVSVNWYLVGSAWQQVAQDFWQGIKRVPIYSMLVLTLCIIIMLLRKLLKNALKQLIARIGNVGKDTYWATPLALILTLVLALPLPILIGAIAGLISISAAPDSFSSAIATALAAVSSLSLTLLFFRSMCRRNGIFIGHFGWSDKAREQLGHLLTWFVWYQGMATLVFASAMASSQTELRYGIAIIAFMAASIGIAWFSYQFFKPKTGVAVNIVGHTQRSTLASIAFPILVSAPLLIGLLPLIGFFDTAVELQSKLFVSGIVLIFVAVFYGIIMRIFMVSYRRYLLRKTKLLRANKEQQRVLEEQREATGDAVPLPKPVEIPDEQAINKKMRHSALAIASLLFLIALWSIWLPLLPALGIVNEIVLWQKTSMVEGLEISSDVTLWNILLAIAFLVGGMLTANNSRGILEISFFDRVNMDPGARYAAITIFGYVILGTSIVLGLSQLGIDWSKLQWIIAALGVGLGFGLQEIVANFVSGLIILFERPVRVGDTVTIGNLSGTVSNIKIRATTITDFENREVLLPNKSIITENVTNWTLGNAVTRILLKIGVAYGSDTRVARDVLLDVINNHPDVLDIPAPSVFFVNHGESSLDFEIRIFVDTTGKRLPVTHEINTLINEALSQHGFEIPFPQRDIHIIGGNLPVVSEPEKTEPTAEQKRVDSE